MPATFGPTWGALRPVGVRAEAASGTNALSYLTHVHGSAAIVR